MYKNINAYLYANTRMYVCVNTRTHEYADTYTRKRMNTHMCMCAFYISDVIRFSTSSEDENIGFRRTLSDERTSCF